MSHSPGVESGDALSILRHGFDVLANDYKRVALLCQQLERQLRETRQLVGNPISSPLHHAHMFPYQDETTFSSRPVAARSIARQLF